MSVELTCAYGLEFRYPAGDTVIGAALRDHGEFAAPEVDLICDLLAAGGDFIDVGANIGAIALPVAKRCSGSAVLAVEASAALAPILAANAAGAGLENLSTLHAAAGARRQIAEFPDVPITAAGNHGAIGFNYKGPGVVAMRPVQMLPLDELATATTRVIKIDVEGYELEVLRGCDRTLATTKPVILFEANSAHPEGTASAISLLSDAGYKMFWFFAPFATPNAPKKAGASNPIRGDTNILALPPGRRSGWLLPIVDSPNASRPKGTSSYVYMAERYGY